MNRPIRTLPRSGPMKLPLLAVLLLMLGLPTWAQKASPALSDPVDQIVATVNGEVVTQSDLVWLLALDPDIPEAKLKQPDEADLRRLLPVKIDLVLLDQEARRLPDVSIDGEEIRRVERQIVARFSSEMLFRRRIESVGITPDILDRLAREQIEVEKYSDFRFRSFIIITEEEVLNYYRDVVRAEAAKRGTVISETPSADDRKTIETIIFNDRVIKEREKFLDAARQRADIVYLAGFAKTGGGSEKVGGRQ